MTEDNGVALTSIEHPPIGDKQVLFLAKRWHEGNQRAMAKIFADSGLDPIKRVSVNTAQCVIDGRLIQFTDGGEPFFVEDCAE